MVNGPSTCLFVVAAVLVVSAGCGGNTPSPVVCAPGEVSWPGSFDLSGQYTVSLAAQTGENQGETVTGSLVLRRAEPAGDGQGSGYRLEYIGSAAIGLSMVGALEMGSIASEDPEMPGVVVQVHRSGEQIDMLMRFGSEANRTDRQRFDGGYTVFRVAGLTDDGFSGTWTSGIARTDASGSFCAVRSS